MRFLPDQRAQIDRDLRRLLTERGGRLPNAADLTIAGLLSAPDITLREPANQVTLAAKYALLEGAEAALFVSSGMAATALAHLAVLRPGDHLLSSAWIYGGTRRLFDEEFGRLGIDVTYVNPDQPRLWRRSVRKSTRAVFVETPTNPLMRVVDLTPMAQIARDGGFALLVDGTFASPINYRPLEHGADIVISSATKYLKGHSDVIAGSLMRVNPNAVST
jgi:cystathionine beta-lyase/cystathionine gamma-synthase